jgi:hypothetical protein
MLLREPDVKACGGLSRVTIVAQPFLLSQEPLTD